MDHRRRGCFPWQERLRSGWRHIARGLQLNDGRRTVVRLALLCLVALRFLLCVRTTLANARTIAAITVVRANVESPIFLLLPPPPPAPSLSTAARSRPVDGAPCATDELELGCRQLSAARRSDALRMDPHARSLLAVSGARALAGETRRRRRTTCAHWH